MAIITLADAKAHLNLTRTETDTLLQQVLDDAHDICERRTGQVWTSRTVTAETRNGDGTSRLQLRWSPVTAVASVTESGTALTAGTDYVLEAETGILWRGTTTAAAAWESGRQNVVVTYTTGPIGGTVPGHIRRGLFYLVEHIWDTRRGGSGGPRNSGTDGEYDPRSGYVIPRRVLECWGLSMPILVG